MASIDILCCGILKVKVSRHDRCGCSAARLDPVENKEWCGLENGSRTADKDCCGQRERSGKVGLQRSVPKSVQPGISKVGTSRMVLL